jgi:hypothetical protein
LAIGLILAVATPALAEFKLNGYYRLMGYSAEVRSGATLSGVGAADAAAQGDDEEGDSRQMIDQRLRLMATYSLNDNVSIVYFAEIDTPWGISGGSLGADAVNVETKNAYLNLKSGDTAAKLGVHAVADAYQGVLYNDDMAGVSVSHKMGNANFNLLYAKLYEDDRSNDDDVDFYDVGVKYKVSDAFNVGGNVLYLNVRDANNLRNDTVADYVPDSAIPGAVPNNAITADIITVGLNADAAFGNFKVDGFALYQDLAFEEEATGDDFDGNAWLATVKGTMKLDNGDVGLRFLYVSPNEDDDDGVDQWVGNFGEYEFPGENLMQFMVDAYVCNYGKESYAWNDAVDNGFGLMAFMASGNHKLPSDMYLKWGAGYFLAATEDVYDDNIDDAEGDTLGWEVAARFGKKYFEKVDVSLNASYADYGDFYDFTATDGDDPDATYKAYLMVNVPF